MRTKEAAGDAERIHWEGPGIGPCLISKVTHDEVTHHTTFTLPDPCSTLPDPCSTLPDPCSTITYPCSMLPDPCSTLPDPCSTIPSNPCSMLPDPCSTLPDPCSTLPDPCSTIFNPCSMLLDPCSTLPDPCRGSLVDVLDEVREGRLYISRADQLRLIADFARGIAYLHGRPNWKVRVIALECS